MIIDLHMHTTESDGEFSPREIVRMAKQEDVKVMAISDHDSAAGVFEAIDEGNKIGIKVIPAIEFNANDNEVKKMHILGYNIDYKSEEFKKIYEELQKDVIRKNNDFFEALNEVDVDIKKEDILEICKSKNIRKPMIAQVLINKGYVNSKEEAYTKYFYQSPFKDVKRENTRLSPKEVISIIKKFGGTPVLAHPYSLGLRDEKLIDKIDELINYGLEGMECFHSRQTKEQMMIYEKIALDRNLIISKGSDFHGLNVYRDTYIGRGKFDNLKDITIGKLNRINEIINI